MPVVIDEKNATIETNFGSAQPRVALRQELNENSAYWNLTIGFNPDPDQLGGAFNFKGSVPVSGTPGELSQFKFGFLQFMRIKEYRIGWAGRHPSEGSILLDIGRVVGRTNLLDCVKSAPRPFFTAPNGLMSGGEMTAKMGDHPFTKVGDVVHNDATGFDNFLFFIADKRIATSVFVAQGPDNRIRPLAHVQFLVNYVSELRWQDDGRPKPFVKSDQSAFLVGDVGAGAPPENIVPRALLTGANAGTSPIANAASQAAMKNTANFQVLKDRFLTVPETFFT